MPRGRGGGGAVTLRRHSTLPFHRDSHSSLAVDAVIFSQNDNVAQHMAIDLKGDVEKEGNVGVVLPHDADGLLSGLVVRVVAVPADDLPARAHHERIAELS